MEKSNSFENNGVKRFQYQKPKKDESTSYSTRSKQNASNQQSFDLENVWSIRKNVGLSVKPTNSDNYSANIKAHNVTTKSNYSRYSDNEAAKKTSTLNNKEKAKQSKFPFQTNESGQFSSQYQTQASKSILGQRNSLSSKQNKPNENEDAFDF